MIGAPLADGNGSDSGSAFVFLGSASGIAAGIASAAAHAVLDGDGADDWFGWSVSSGGDVNGDGYGDLVVGAPYDDNNGANSGSAFVFLGSASGIAGGDASATADAVLDGDGADDWFGWSVSSAGDVNGDGYSDLVVGAHGDDNNLSASGSAFVFLGSASGIAEGSASAAAHAVLDGDGEGDQFGGSVSWAGDVNGDSYGDLVVGAWQDDNNGTDSGSAFVFLGSASGIAGGDASATADAVLDGDGASDGFGRHSVSSAGDLDGDGYGDVVVGAFRDDDNGDSSGSAFVFLGSPSGLAGGDASAVAHAVLSGDGINDLFGFSVSSAGDVNGDGFGDLVVGARYDDNNGTNSGSAFVFLGNFADGTTPGWNPAPQALQPSTVTPIAPGLRSASTDSFDLALLARSPFGRTGVKLQVEVEPLGTPFDGTGLVSLGAWTDTGIAGVQLQETVASLSAETPYHWRARVFYDSADGHPQGWSHWLWGGRSGDPEGTHLVTACALDTDGDGQCDTSDLDDDGDDDPDSTDCAPLDPTVFAGAPETPDDGIDQDCNGADTVTCFVDADGDGYAGSSTELDPDGDCTDDVGQDDADLDCDDDDPAAFPGNPEVCDGQDNDCDGLVPADEVDDDGDGLAECEGDCDDADPGNFPGNTETCDGQDNDCDGLVPPEEIDDDGDGVAECEGDCDDADPGNFPGNPETCDGQDNDCDGAVDVEFDSDGDGVTTCGPDGDASATADNDCNDGDATIYPSAPESCDAIDSDCDGSLVDGFDDLDGDLDPDCTDPDDDGDTVPDASDSDPTDPLLCSDSDADGCDDCSSGSFAPAADGLDTDSDGLCDAGDPDDDNDAVPDASDSAPINPLLCSDIDGDGCDDCSQGAGFAPAADGLDTDGDGLCDSGDPDDDDDGVDDTLDSLPLDPLVCADTDADLCDDCSGGEGFDPAQDGDDLDGDGRCDLGDPDDDDDGIPDGSDSAPEDPTLCEDADGDGCDDCAVGRDGFGPQPDADTSNDGPDLDGDGLCDSGDTDADGDGWDAGGEEPDCDDADPQVHPGAEDDPCDEVDSDCDGETHDAMRQDGDGDGFTPCEGDCDDEDPYANPDEPEVCDPPDHLDQDCDPATDELEDGDGDGLSLCDGDCDDEDPRVLYCEGDDDDSAGLAEAPGCALGCGAIGRGERAGSAGLLVLAGLLLALRRQPARRRPSRQEGTMSRHRSATAASLLALLFVCAPGSAGADEASEIAARAWDVHQARCAEVAAGPDASAADSMVEVTEVWREVISVYERTGFSYLLYWRGVLAECLGQPERAATDLQLFVALEEFEEAFVPQVRDARTRLRRAGVEVTEPTPEALAAARELDRSNRSDLATGSRSLRAAAREGKTPLFLLGFAGGYQRTSVYNYGLFGLDASLKLVGPLRVEVSVRAGVSVSYTDPDGETSPVGRYMLMAIGVGPTLEFDGPVRPRVGAWFQVAPNGSGIGGPKVLPGFVVHGGVDLPLRGSPVALRPAIEGGILGPMPMVRVLLELVLGF